MTPATLSHTASSEASKTAKTPTTTASESSRSTLGREASKRAKQRIHEGATKSNAVEIRDSDEDTDGTE